MGLPICVNLLSVELKEIVKADTEPTTTDGYEAVLLKDLSYTKLWLIYKVVE